MELRPGTSIDRYTVESKLGEGGMAKVYRVRHQQLGTSHALKVLTLTSPAIQERLLQEGRVQAQLNHRNIVSVTDVIDVNGASGLIMEFVNGPTLEALIARQRLNFAQVDELAQEIVSAMAEAHKRDLIHRDLKPANIILE
ncbi:MAG: protein kinase, partial [Proteobacteria bacterium]|nr:protein kinase [Pseudomonadota bacterium]